MSLLDRFRFVLASVASNPTRTALIAVAMSMGVASVLVLTSLGNGARNFVIGEFQSLGSHLIIVLPGRTETVGGAPPLMGATPRDLTLNDAAAIGRSSAVARIAPIVVGGASISHRSREREATVIGTTAAFAEVRTIKLARGQFLPSDDLKRERSVCVLGARLVHELFGRTEAIGTFVRIGDRRLRVIGVLASEGRSIGLDLEDIALVPVATAQAMFDTPSLFRLLVQARSESLVERVKSHVRATIRTRHDGEDDITIITQDALVATFGQILDVLTMTLGGIAGISLAVAGILIGNIMVIAVAQRVNEVGLLKALGAPSDVVLSLFLLEAALLASLGALIGLGIGLAAVRALAHALPEVALSPPWWAMVLAPAAAIGFGVVFGLLPALRASRLEPVAALSRRG